MKRVLALDGGGIRGLFTARILAEMEKRSGKRIDELFDLIAGVSTGGILATMLTAGAGYPADTIVAFYQKEGPGIFSAGIGRKILSVGGVLRNRYSNKALKSALDRYLGQAALDSTTIPILVSAFDIGNNTPFFFKTFKAQELGRMDQNFYLADVALATAAAPTYFDPAKVRPIGYDQERYLIDGGIFGTNPAMHAYAEAGRRWPGETCSVLSIGTGGFWGPRDPKKFFGAGDVQWVSPLLGMMLEGGSQTVDYQLRWRGCWYQRINRSMVKASGDMDDASQKNLDALLWEAEMAIAEESAEIDSALALLTSPIAA